MKVLTVVGARPQFVKAAVVSRVIRQTAGITECLVHTGQHYDANMSDVFFREMEIPAPDLFLGIGGGGHGQMTGRMLEKLEEVMVAQQPDIVLVYGDTNSTLAGALAAAKLHIPVAHVEAGLRSWNMRMPEEINRILTDRISNLLFCPTKTAVENLATEGMGDNPNLARKILNCGDVMFDAVRYYRKTALPTVPVAEFTQEHKNKFVLVTVHRADNTDNADCLKNIFNALDLVAKEQVVVCPVHPRTASRIQALGLQTDRIQLWEPVGYFDMLALLDSCAGVLTDSGGLQKEAYFFNKPCVTLREETEWVELVESGWNVLAGADCHQILTGVANFSQARPAWNEGLYGDGYAGEKIVAELLRFP